MIKVNGLVTSINAVTSIVSLNKGKQSELGKLSSFLKNTQKSRQLTQSVVTGVSFKI